MARQASGLWFVRIPVGHRRGHPQVISGDRRVGDQRGCRPRGTDIRVFRGLIRLCLQTRRISSLSTIRLPSGSRAHQVPRLSNFMFQPQGPAADGGAEDKRTVAVHLFFAMS